MNLKRFIHIGSKKLDYYKGLLIRADLGLHDQIAETLVKLLPAGARILDMGAGQGALSLRLKDLGFSVTAVDVNKEDFSASESDIEYIQLNFNDKSSVDAFISSHQNMFDAVCGVEVIEHVENPWEYVRNLTSLVKEGGVVLVTTPNTTSWLSRFMFFWKGQCLSFDEGGLVYGHINPVSAWELHVIMERIGLKNVTVSPAGTLPPVYAISLKYTILSLLMLLFRPLQKGLIDGWCVIATGQK
jgi:SAM-dependent methyltransferase